MKRFTIDRDKGRWAHGICYGRQRVIHFIPGTVLNEHYVKWIVKVLNGERVEPPELPEAWEKKVKPEAR